MDEIALEAQKGMGKTIESFKNELSTLRTGRATPAMLDRVEADYYGDRLPINQLSSITCPEPRQLVIKPYDRNDIKAIVSAISAANLGLNPINEGDLIRITIAPLTEESRRDLVKKGKGILEENKVAIRNIRRDFIDLVKDSDDMTDDYKKRVEDDIQKVTDESIAKIEELFANKEKEIMAI